MSILVPSSVFVATLVLLELGWLLALRIKDEYTDRKRIREFGDPDAPDVFPMYHE